MPKWRRLRFLFLFLSAVLIEAPAFGQETPCPSPPACGSLEIEGVRVYPNVATDCTDNTDACGDRFSQMFFKVYLRIETPLSSTPFNLDYSTLDVSVRLKNQNSPIQYSYIDALATDDCFKNSPNGSKWYGYNDGDANSVIWNPTEQEVSLSFANLTDMTPDCGTTTSGKGNQITFTYNKPDCTAGCGKVSTSCAYVELFTVVVNAYPGEWLYLEVGDRLYVPSSDPGAYCDPIGIENAIANQNCYAFANPASATALPSTYTSTPNDDIEAELLDPVPDGNGGYNVTVQIKNYSTTESRSIEYLEFLLQATTFQMDKPFTYTGAAPRILDGTSSGPNEQVRYLHYRIDAGGQTLGPSATWAASIIHIGPPMLTNQQWSAELVFVDGGTKSRLKTDEPACTALKTTGESEIDETGTLLCTNTSVEFFMEGAAGNCAGTSATMRIGLRSTSSPEQLRFRQVKFDLVFDLDPGVTISGVDFSNWPSVSCNPHGCVQPNTCWEVSPDGKTLSYCYLTTIQGSPYFDLDPEQYMVVTFSNTGNGCVRSVTPTLVELAYASQQIQELITCIPPITSATGLPQCGPLISGTLATETNEGLPDVTVRLKNTCGSATCNPSSGACAPPTTANSTQTGFFGFCSICPDCDKFDVEPFRNNDPLNGVSTFDLLLINKHILGTETLNSPYKMIAADANSSKSITTFDIVELRKLILGIYQNLPHNDSWRFVDAAFTFPNPANPFQTIFPETITCVEAPAADLDFVAVKVGDVNGNAVTNRPESERPVLTLDFGAGVRAKGEAFTVPVIYTGDRPIEAFQLGLRFDPAVLELLGPSLGDLPGQTPDHFGLGRAAEGEIRTLWLSPTGDEFDRIAPGTVLFHLSFRALGDLPETAAALRLDDLVLDNAAWETDGTEYALAEASASAERQHPKATTAALRAHVRPNPASGAVQYVVQAPSAMSGRIALFDAFGKLIFMRRIELVAGEQMLTAPETEALPPGVYIWKVIAEGQKAAGHLLKQ